MTPMKTSALALLVSTGLAAAPALAQQAQSQPQTPQAQQTQPKPQTQTGSTSGAQASTTDASGAGGGNGGASQPMTAETSPKTGQGAPMSKAEGEMPEAMPKDEARTAESGDATGDAMDAESDAGADTLIAKVGDREIRASDLRDAIGVMPPRMRQMPADMLLPAAMDQLITRELILAEAEAAGLAEDPEVTAMTEADTEAARDTAMIRVWLQREMNERVGDQAVRDAYEQAAAAAGRGAGFPSFEQVRPAIERSLRQNAMRGIREDLMQDAELVLYGPDGEPMDNAFTSSQ